MGSNFHVHGPGMLRFMYLRTKTESIGVVFTCLYVIDSFLFFILSLQLK